MSERKNVLYLTDDEVTNFSSSISFVLNYCDIPQLVAGKLVSLQVYLENLTSDKR